MKPLRIAFLGSDPIALPMLGWLSGEGSHLGKIVGVFTKPDRPVGRGQKVTPNEIKSWAESRGLPVFQPEKLTEDARLELGRLQADLSLVMAYGHILRDDFIATPRLGTVNLHTSLLPKYRGASPIQTAIAAGEKETGVSFMRIVRRLDAGPVAAVECVPIESLDTAQTVETKLSAACIPLVRRTLGPLAEGTLEFHPQDDARATFCRRLTKEDGALDFSKSAAELAARINGLFPWPACSVEIDGQPIKFGLADTLSADVPSPATVTAPGTTVESANGTLWISTGNGILRVRQLQRPGGRMLAAAEFLRGFPIREGTPLPSRAMTVLVGTSPLK